jgi:CelD/BcsL family acetyltransferase involved in cellulose biosynthesis
MSLPCPHTDAVPVTLATTGETVAALCPECDRQLPAEWIGCDHADSIDTTRLSDPVVRLLCQRCGVEHADPNRRTWPGLAI